MKLTTTITLTDLSAALAALAQTPPTRPVKPKRGGAVIRKRLVKTGKRRKKQ